MGRQMFAHGGTVYPMQEGGMAPPMAPPMAPAPMAPPPSAPPMAGMQSELDPAILEKMLGSASQQMDTIDNATDATTMINGMRGDELPLEARYAELASIVGPEDANATPESVLTLIQPVLQIAAVDQGIGGLAEEQMMAPIEGPMAGGIMSTVNMGASEGPNPVNFNQGGPVQYFEEGAAVLPNRFDTVLQQQKDRYRDIIGGDQQTDFDEQKNLTQAQMLFDVAQGALAFASPGDSQMSAAERLAQSFTPVLGNIGARAGELQKFKQSQQAEKRQLDLAALGSTETMMAAENLADSKAPAMITNLFDVWGTDSEGNRVMLQQGMVPTEENMRAARVRWPGQDIGFEKQLKKPVETKGTNLGKIYNLTYTDSSGEQITQKGVPVTTVEEFMTWQEKFPDISMVEVGKSTTGEASYTILAKPGQTNVSILSTDVDSINAHIGDGYEVVNKRTAPSDKEAKSAEWIQFVNPQDDTDYLLFDINDTSAANKTNMYNAANATDAEGARIYRVGSNYSPASGSGTPNIKVFVDRNNTDMRKQLDLNNADDLAEYRALGDNWSMTTVPTLADLATGPDLGKGENAKLMQLLSNQDTMDAYAANTLDPNIANLINSYLTDKMRLKSIFDESTQSWIMSPGLKVTKSVLGAIEARGKIDGASLPTIGAQGLTLNADPDDNTTGRIKFNKDNSIDFTSFEEDPLFLITGEDLTRSQGIGSTISRIANFFVAQWGETPFGEPGAYAGEGGKITSKADAQLEALARNIVNTARAGVDGRLFSYDIELLKEEVAGFRPGGFSTDNGARDKLVVVRQSLSSMYVKAHSAATTAGTQQDIAKATKLRSELEQLLAETTAAISIYDKYLSTDPIATAQSDRAKLSRTSDSPRASSGGSD